MWHSCAPFQWSVSVCFCIHIHIPMTWTSHWYIKCSECLSMWKYSISPYIHQNDGVTDDLSKLREKPFPFPNWNIQQMTETSQKANIGGGCRRFSDISGRYETIVLMVMSSVRAYFHFDISKQVWEKKSPAVIHTIPQCICVHEKQQSYNDFSGQDWMNGWLILPFYGTDSSWMHTHTLSNGWLALT